MKKPSIKTLHYFSGLGLLIFIFFHLLNHLISIAGVDNHIEWMKVFRLFYRHPILEILLLFLLIFQIISGIKLWFKTRKKSHTFYESLQRLSGLYLAIFFIIHISAVALGRYILHLDTNIYFGAAGINSFPHNLFFIPYYAFAILAVFAHLAAVHHKKMKTYLIFLSPKQQSHLILVVGIIITLLIFYGLTDGFSGLSIPSPYDI